MNKISNTKVAGAGGRPFLLDVQWVKSEKPKPVVVFLHGFKGFKDWGHWDKIGAFFAEAGLVFVKFNFTHNGTTIDDPLNFADLEAFGMNNFSKELEDVNAALTWLENNAQADWNLNNIILIGHSRGGGIALLQAAADSRIKKLITWAGVSRLDYGHYFNEDDSNLLWKEMGVLHILNGRTKQNMPLYYQLYENFIENKEKLSTEKAAKHLEKPYLIIHGSDDPAVGLDKAETLKNWCPHSELFIIEDADHVFGGKHPWEESGLPEHSKQMVEKSIDFIVS